MTIMTDPTLDTPVQKSITVKASPERAFQVFTDEIDTWWPRTHHIGKAPMKKALIEGRLGGRCYTEQTDGTECDWGQVLVWEPPARFVMAWQIDYAGWRYEPDLAKSSEVEVRFTPESDGTTRVDVEHRHFNRHGETGAGMRFAVGAPNGWSGILQLFAARVEATV
jgi:uncharacterized protein YndB with AHSA1/START domain